MSISVASPSTTSLRRTTVVVAAVAAATTTLAAVTLRAAGVHLAAGGRIPLAAFAQFTFAGALLGGLLVAVLNRRSTLPRRRFIQIAVMLTALSCLAPAAAADNLSSKLGLIAIHLLAATLRRRSRWVASGSLKPPTSTPRSTWPHGAPRPAAVRSRSVRCRDD